MRKKIMLTAIVYYPISINTTDIDVNSSFAEQIAESERRCVKIGKAIKKFCRELDKLNLHYEVDSSNEVEATLSAGECPAQSDR